MATGRLHYFPRRITGRITERKPKKSFPLGCDVDKEDIFDYPYLTDENTIEFFKKHGRIMFIIRGPNSTMKATLSEMITKIYPGSQHCCADHYFSKTFSAPERTKETLKLSHNYCEKLVEQACMKNKSPVIVQNTHIRKWELQKYLNLAAIHNYTVVMAITLYKFDVTPEGLERTSADGLNVEYFRNRTRQWEDISPLFTGLFLSLADATFILKSMRATSASLLNDGCFCRTFDVFDSDDIDNYFAPRRNLYCKLGYSPNKTAMKKYYLSDLVQDCYGKSYNIAIHGYIVTSSAVMGIVQVCDEVKPLIFDSTAVDDDDDDDDVIHLFSELNTTNAINEYKSTVSFDLNCDSNKTVVLEKNSAENINIKNCRLIHLANRRFQNFNISNVEVVIQKLLLSLEDEIKYTKLEEGISISRQSNNMWIIMLPETIKTQTVFTGLYV